MSSYVWFAIQWLLWFLLSHIWWCSVSCKLLLYKSVLYREWVAFIKIKWCCGCFLVLQPLMITVILIEIKILSCLVVHLIVIWFWNSKVVNIFVSARCGWTLLIDTRCESTFIHLKFFQFCLHLLFTILINLPLFRQQISLRQLDRFIRKWVVRIPYWLSFLNLLVK